MFGTDEKASFTGEGKAKLGCDIFQGELVKFTKKVNKKFDSEDTETVLEVTLLGEKSLFYNKEEVNKIHIENLKQPTGKDEESLKKNNIAMFYKVGHLLSAVLSSAEMDAYSKMKAATWEAFIDNCVKTLGSKGKGVKVEFKLIGGVFNSIVFAKLPNFSNTYTVPFILPVKGGKSVEFTNNEKTGNQEYFSSLKNGVAKSEDEEQPTTKEKKKAVINFEEDDLAA